MTVGTAGEEAIIRRLAARFPARTEGPVVCGIGDDGALLRGPGDLLQVVTTDLLLAGTHFNLDWTPPDLLGQKSLAVNLSDLAAMGAEPQAFFLDLGLPPHWPLAEFDRFLDGLATAARAAGDLPLAGGDTCRAADLHIGVTLLGQVHPGRVIRRDGGQAGDLLAVSGPLGAAGAGLLLLQEGWRLVPPRAIPPATAGAGLDPSLAAQALTAHLAPQVDIGLGRTLAGVVSSGMDLSDGLAADLPRLCRASGCGARVVLEEVPVAGCAAVVDDLHGLPAGTTAISGGEDYRLLVSVPPATWNDELVRKTGLTAIGRLTGSAGSLILVSDGQERGWPDPGFGHFREP
jgi:thiamine-monophosphate kinase